jgi:hypothetical protein
MPENGQIVVIDGAGERYRVLAYGATFVLGSEACDAIVQVDLATLRALGVEWNGRMLRVAEGES